MKENISMAITRYRDQDNQPACAMDFTTGDVCVFYRTQKFGCSETCVFAPEGHRGKTKSMERRKEGVGTLIPGEWCPVWEEI